jgi:hypothetical protein
VSGCKRGESGSDRASVPDTLLGSSWRDLATSASVLWAVATKKTTGRQGTDKAGRGVGVCVSVLRVLAAVVFNGLCFVGGGGEKGQL